MQDPESPRSSAEPLRRALSLKFFGLGGAGCNVVDWLSTAGFPELTLLALNTDAQALAQANATHKYQLGAKLTRGLGTGGDAELGREAAELESAQLKDLCAGADIVFLAVGLGGGTGMGAAPVLARLARESGTLVLAFAILPFACEGARRQKLAQAGLQKLRAAADAVICLPNERLSQLIDQNTSLVQTFRLSHEFLGQGLRGLCRLLTRPGLMNVDFAHLCTVMRGPQAESTFAMAEARGPNRAREVMDKILAHPWFEAGQILAQAESVLVSIAGGADLNLAEVNRVMEQVNRQCENAEIILGAAIDENLQNRLEVTLIASSKSHLGETAVAARNDEVHNPTRTSDSGLEISPLLGTPTVAPRSASRLVPPPPEMSQEQAEQLLRQKPASRLRKALPQFHQEQLPLQIVSKGRFENSEPTIHQGEDLDVPTYMRRGVPLN